MCITNRMPAADRRHLLLVSIRHIRRKNTQYSKQINQIATLIVKGKAPATSLLSTVNVLLGHDKMRNVLVFVRDSFIAFKIRKRVFQHDAPLCHGCFSFPSVIKCERCEQVAFGYGCLDYGTCDACQSLAKGSVSNESAPPREYACVPCSDD